MNPSRITINHLGITTEYGLSCGKCFRCFGSPVRTNQLALEDSHSRYYDLYNLAPVGYFTVFEKNPPEMQHSERVGRLSADIAPGLDLGEEAINQIRVAGRMHDIGKIGVTETILNKPMKLNDAEWKEVERHSEIGYRILGSVNEFAEVADFILEHHEKWNGKGYPKGLRHEATSVQARIIAIADAYDAMTGNRPYGRALSPAEAVQEINRCAGTQFDPTVSRHVTRKFFTWRFFQGCKIHQAGYRQGIKRHSQNDALLSEHPSAKHTSRTQIGGGIA